MSGVRAGFEGTLFTILRTRDLLAVAVLSVILYAFYYPAPYAHQVAEGLPVVIVDRDQTALSRRLVRELGETRAVRVVGVAPDMAAAQAAVRAREADGILLLSHGIGAQGLSARPGDGVALWLNGTYLLRAEAVASGIGEVVADVVAGQLGARLAETARGAAVPVLLHPLFNTTGGYRDYIFPAVANIILQQTLLLASARLMAERRRVGRGRLGLGEALGMWAACALIGVLAAFFYFGFVYWVQDIPRGGNMPALLLAVPPFAAAVAGLGLLIGSFFDNGDDALKMILPTSLPLVFLAGFAWPLDHMPGWLATLAWASPATGAMHLFIRLNQMGATLAEVRGPLLIICLLALIYGGAFLWRSVWRAAPAR